MAAKVSKTREALKHSIIWFVLIFAFFPFYLMFVISFKNNDQFVVNPFLPDWPSQWHGENWLTGWYSVYAYIANSIVTSFGAVIFCLIMAILASYVLARYRFPGRSLIYYSLIGTMFLPGTPATLVTLFSLVKDMGMVNKLYALVIIGATGGQVVCVFILKQFIEEIPKELFEAAEIDGAGHLTQIRQIILPMSGSVLTTLAIMQFIGSWNNLMLPLILMRDDALLTIPVGLLRLDGEYVKQWGPLMAGYAISSIPMVLLFLFTMRLFVKGLAAGAVKG